MNPEQAIEFLRAKMNAMAERFAASGKPEIAEQFRRMAATDFTDDMDQRLDWLV